ncbi:alpha-1,2-mannosyltransferase ALG9-like isoform X2 [Centruroides sculpturatus]|nr:alpha-1,2-mannosyltransferase ALG9-like isoform X2 [Centruroides sculpturatus]XP_023236317.1 alpha-1,2-mannosyltransferase ALG9-like isoform X2 [Centruroides sculpturatus]
MKTSTRNRKFNASKIHQERVNTIRSENESSKKKTLSYHVQKEIVVLLFARLCSVLWNNISDCDETFNYWEPTHYMLYGHGFQTWEYSPAYAIRSYAYIWIHALPGYILSQFLHQKILVFYLIRSVLGTICVFSEVYFYKGICYQFGYKVGTLTLIFLTFATGTFISSTAYLPSSFSMYMIMISFAGLFLHHYKVAIISTALSTLVGWPFAAVLGLPIAYDIVILKRKWYFFIKWCVISLVIILIPIVFIDSYYYGRLVIAPLNIMLYNVFSKNGSQLYGVEPWTYYFFNGFLNFNIVFIMAFTSSLTLVFYQFMFHPSWTHKPNFIKLLESMSAMYIWIIIFFLQPHKEERFLFPIYPFFCLFGALTTDLFQKTLNIAFQRYHLPFAKLLTSTICMTFVTISLLRTVAIYKGYSAPIRIYSSLANTAENRPMPLMDEINVCTGKEWHRFPSHFFLPSNWRLQFLQSDFRGQLPKLYSNETAATRIIPKDMNDENREETSRYFDIKRCRYLIDADFPRSSILEPRYSQDAGKWKVKFSESFLDAERSPKLSRAFYIPFITEDNCKYVNYNLLEKTV